MAKPMRVHSGNLNECGPVPGGRQLKGQLITWPFESAGWVPYTRYSPIAIYTGGYSFYRPVEVESCVDLGTTESVQPMPKAASYRRGFRVKHNTGTSNATDRRANHYRPLWSDDNTSIKLYRQFLSFVPWTLFELLHTFSQTFLTISAISSDWKKKTERLLKTSRQRIENSLTRSAKNITKAREWIQNSHKIRSLHHLSKTNLPTFVLFYLKS